MSIRKLAKFVPPPHHPIETGSPKQWAIVQERLGTPLPPDYKTFIDTYGTGNFNDLILPYTPFSARDDLNLFQVLDAHHQANRLVRAKTSQPWSAVEPFELFPIDNGLLPWGVTAHIKKTFFWKVNGPPQTWITIFYDLQTGEYEVWKMPFLSFLVKLISGKIETVLLPDNFQSQLTPVEYIQYPV